MLKRRNLNSVSYQSGTKWLYFYIYIRFPISFVLSAISIISQFSQFFNNEYALSSAAFYFLISIDFTIYLFRFVVYIKIRSMTKTGLILNYILLAVESAFQIAVNFYSIPFFFIWLLLNTIYFYKRKSMFGNGSHTKMYNNSFQENEEPNEVKDNFVDNNNHYKSTLSSVYNNYTQTAKNTFFRGGKKQADSIVKSLCKILNIDTQYITTNQLCQVLNIYSDIYIRANVTGMSASGILSSLLIKHKSLLTTKEIAESVIAFCIFNMKDSTYSITSEDELELLVRSSKDICENPEHEQSFDKQNQYINDPQYGLSVTKPVYVNDVSSAKEYLNSLRTDQNIKLFWERTETFYFEKLCDTVDRYTGTLPTGQRVCNIYINPYGSENSKTAPHGFCFSDHNHHSSTTKETLNKKQNFSKKFTEAKNITKNNLKRIIAIAIVCVVIISAFFVVQYNQMPNKAKGKLGTYLSLYLPDYISMNNVSYSIDSNGKGFVIVIGGNVKGSKSKAVTLYAEIQFNFLCSNPTVDYVRINDRRFEKSELKLRSYNYWWN